MSQLYRMTVEVVDYDPAKKDAIIAAGNEEWSEWEDNWQDCTPTLTVSAEDNLAGLSNDEFAGQVAIAIWRANGKYCRVVVYTTFLEDIPTDMFSMREEEYEDFLAKQTKLQENPS